ncbi:MAG TPA: PRC-barrel domain-containing protein [Rhodocyclaceae bacterium]|jgi:sporulation protein YlmC with PRC-barrel domain|nr:PRC-barrel domain-containing protein [Rhodocyclaceae bacterium]HRQ47329.1 PRC-barrel domain-containing protein [Rhodocyclaceae bacterium]
MNTKLQKTLIAGAVMALIASPAWAASDASEYPAATPQAETGQPMQSAPMDTAPQMGTASEAFSDNPIYNSTPDELRRVEVRDSEGNKVGRVKTVVLGPDHESAHAVVSVGGILGLGAREIIVSLDELQIVEDRLQVSVTREDLEARGDYEPEQYVELEPETPIREFSAFEPIPDTGEPAASEPDESRQER